jgi:hypothetical protein
MSQGCWDPPDTDAYSRVTNPERFQPIVDFVVDRFENLIRTFDVARSETFQFWRADDIQSFEPLRPPIALTPRRAGSAPLAVAFTAFPSVLVRCGYWRLEPFPRCGCDACQETAAGEIARFSQIVDADVEGRFHEDASRPFLRRAVVRHEFHFADGTGRSGGTRYLTRAHARELLRGRPLAPQWTAWQTRV